MINHLLLNSYSTKEQKIGTWLGKPLYRKVVDVGALPNNAVKHVPHNITNLGSVIRIYGWAFGVDLHIPLPFTSTYAPYSVMCNVLDTNIQMEAGYDRSNMSGYIILEYTKTTD